jgi:hypothetical protein
MTQTPIRYHCSLLTQHVKQTQTTRLCSFPYSLYSPQHYCMLTWNRKNAIWNNISLCVQSVGNFEAGKDLGLQGRGMCEGQNLKRMGYRVGGGWGVGGARRRIGVWVHGEKLWRGRNRLPSFRLLLEGREEFSCVVQLCNIAVMEFIVKNTLCMNGLWLVSYGGLRSKWKFFVRSLNIMKPKFCYVSKFALCHVVAQLVKALRYKTESRGVDSCLQFFIDIILPAALWSWIRLSL